MTEECTPMQPTAEHRRLMENAGVWKVACTFYMDPSQPPMKIEAVETVTSFGAFFTTSVFEADMFGSPFKGCATLGYEPHEGRWVSTWIDTMSPSMFQFTGNFDASGETLEMTGTGLSPFTGKNAAYRTTETWTGPNQRTFEMFVTAPDGNEMKMFTHVYTRA